MIEQLFGTFRSYARQTLQNEELACAFSFRTVTGPRQSSVRETLRLSSEVNKQARRLRHVTCPQYRQPVENAHRDQRPCNAARGTPNLPAVLGAPSSTTTPRRAPTASAAV